MKYSQLFHSLSQRCVTGGAALTCAAAMVLAAAPTQAQDKPVQFKLSSWLPAQHPLNPALMASSSLPFMFANGKGRSAAIDAWYPQSFSTGVIATGRTLGAMLPPSTVLAVC